MWETRVQSLGKEDPLKKKMTTHSSILIWIVLWTEEPGRLQSMGSQRVRLDCVTEHTYTHISQTIMLYALNLYSANINHVSIKLGEKKIKKKKKKPGPSPCTTRSFRAASRMVTTMRPPCVLGSRGPELLCLPSTFQSSHACFIYKVQGVWLYLAEGEIDIRGIGPRMSISSSQERKFPELPWLSSG